VVLIAATAAAYAPVGHFGFLTWDDPQYVYANAHVAQGLTWQGAWWALTATEAANWHPLTWLSHMLDVQIYGMDAGPQHVTNLLIHILNSLLLFGVLYRMTGAWGRSTFAAGLFALHPLHVESVAWIAERKDVLSALFWMLTMWAYVTYARRPGWRRYWPVLVFFTLGLMTKPMLVTLPFVLLLLDFWPLQRVKQWRLVWEKAPLFALAAISSAVTVLVQQHGGAIQALEKVPWSFRLANAPAAYLAYAGKMLWPARLAAFYPIGTSAPVVQAIFGALFLGGATFFAIRAGRRHGYVLAGWLWYVGTLIPVIGLVQVGNQSMADRYSYVPLTGLFIVIAWGTPELLAHWQHARVALPAAAACVLLACAALDRAQLSYWTDSGVLWQRAVDMTDDNYIARNNLGSVLLERGKAAEAVAQFGEALRLRPNYAEARDNLATALVWQGKLDEAARQLREALRIMPGLADARYKLGVVLMSQGKRDEAIGSFAEALRTNPGFAEAHYRMGNALEAQGRAGEAIAQYREAVRLKPDFAEAHNDLGAALGRQGNVGEAVQHFIEALRIKPDLASAGANLKVALATQKEAGQRQ
jgi:Flp pilus assembly protein TadD